MHVKFKEYYVAQKCEKKQLFEDMYLGSKDTSSEGT